MGFRRTVHRYGGHGLKPEVLPDRVGEIVFERTGMGLLVCHAQVGQCVNQFPWFDFQFSSQLVDSDLHKTAAAPLGLPLLTHPSKDEGLLHFTYRIRFLDGNSSVFSKFPFASGGLRLRRRVFGGFQRGFL